MPRAPVFPHSRLSTLPIFHACFSRCLVYQYSDGADGIIVQQSGTDTLWIGRDAVGGVGRVVLVRTEGHGNKYGGTSGLRWTDSVAVGLDGHLIFWRWQMLNLQVPAHSITMATTFLSDSVRYTYQRQDDALLPRATYEVPATSILDGIPARHAPRPTLGPGYARSVSVLDLLGGETTPGFARSIEIRVTGREWVTVPAGRFHCWVVEYSLAPEPGEHRHTSSLYVEMTSGVLVRAEWRPGLTFYGEQVLIDSQVTR